MIALFIAIAAVIVILSTSILKTVDMDKKHKNLIATGISLVAGGLTAFVEAGASLEELTAGGVLGTVLLVYGASQIIYKHILPDSVDEYLTENVGR